MEISTPLISHHLSKNDMATLFSVIQACVDCSSKEELNPIVEGLKELVPFEYFTCVHTRLDGGELCDSSHVINVDYPKDWVGLYMEKKYHRVDPIVKENFSRFTVQYWADTYNEHPPDRGFVSNAEDFGLCSGYTSGVRNLAGTVGGLFSFAGRDVPSSELNREIVAVVTPHLYQAVERIICKERLDKVPALSAREKEVLKWVAFGKTGWETSVIMNISERTVKFHMNNIMKKLNVATRTHAVAVAAELGILEPD